MFFVARPGTTPQPPCARLRTALQTKRARRRDRCGGWGAGAALSLSLSRAVSVALVEPHAWDDNRNGVTRGGKHKRGRRARGGRSAKPPRLDHSPLSLSLFLPHDAMLKS